MLKLSGEALMAGRSHGIDPGRLENYIQEARSKIDALAALPVAWHFIGHLQSNKAKFVAGK